MTEDGTTTAELLLTRETRNPPHGAAPLRLTVHVSVPAVAIEAELQESEAGTGIPFPLMFTIRLPAIELLTIVRTPVNVLPPIGVIETVSVAVCPGLSVRGVAIPDAANREPATDRLEIVTGPVPVEDKVRT